jgi:hypothetical protein
MADLRTLPEGSYAVPSGTTRLKVRIERGKPGSKWDGWIFVKDAAEYGQGRRYGNQRPGESEYRGAIGLELALICADPAQSMAAYGKLVGKCGACGRPLEDKESVERGIGPVCAKKLGF